MSKLRKLTPMEMSSLVNEETPGTESHNKRDSMIRIMCDWGDSVGHDEVAKVAAMISLVYRSPRDRHKTAEYRKQELERLGIPIPDLINEIIEKGD